MIVFIYQIVTKPLTSKILTEEICPVCNKKEGIELILYMRYISMIIPFFGMGRHTGVVCNNCGTVLKNPHASVFAKKKYSTRIAAAIKDIRSNHKRTLWQLLYPWSICFVIPVIILIALLIASINENSAKDKAKQYSELISHPQSGDIYKSLWVEKPLSEGVLVKLLRINGDTMYVVKTKKTIPFSYFEEDWNKLSSDSDAFESKEYKVMKFKNLNDNNFGRFMMYNNDGKDNFPIFLGEILNGRCSINLDFETIERKK